MLVFLWQEIFQSTGRAETSTPEEQCSGWWRGQGEQLLLNFSEVLHLSCMIWNVWNILPVLIWRDQWAYLRLNFEACTRLCWEICLLYLCLEKLLFRLLNKSIFFGRAEKKKKTKHSHCHLFEHPPLATQKWPELLCLLFQLVHRHSIPPQKCEKKTTIHFPPRNVNRKQPLQYWTGGRPIAQA